jgi:hypothetical protein
MSSMPQTTACVLGLRADRENAKPAELSGQARRLRQRVPPGDRCDALPGCAADLNLPVADEAPLPIAAVAVPRIRSYRPPIGFARISGCGPIHRLYSRKKRSAF